jgi:hypothetical protein
MTVNYIRFVLFLAFPLLLVTSGVRAADGPGTWWSELNGEWLGEHQCGGKPVAIKLRINVDAKGKVRGTREFYPTPANPRVRIGVFLVSGNYDSTKNKITLLAGDWIVKPEGYTKCHLYAQWDKKGKFLHGTTTQCGHCGYFMMKKQ